MIEEDYPLMPWLKGGYRKALQFVIWTSFVITIILTRYINHHMPKGEMRATSEYVCTYDDRGRCGPEYIEDISNLDLPQWIKFFKKDYWIFLVMGLPILGILLSSKKNYEDY